MNKPASELIARLEASQRACFDAGLHVAAMDIQSARAEIARTAANQSGSERAGVDVKNAVYWAVGRWNAEVANRPLRNIHRRGLDTTWRQVIRHFGGDDVELCGPRHDELIEATPPAQPAPASDEASTKGCDCGVMCQDLRDGCRYRPSEAPAAHGKPDGAVRLDASEQEAESAIRHLKIVIDAAENSNQSGENAVVRAALVTGWKRP